MKLGIDVGGTQTKIAVITDSCEMLAVNSCPTVVGSALFLDFICRIIEEYRKSFPDIGDVGVGIPGKADARRGTIVFSPALQILESLDFCKEVHERCGLPVFVENDVNAWALAEKTVGVCRMVDTYVLIAIGTGIGAGIVIDGRIYRGFNFEAGEIGYMVSREDYDSQCPTKNDFGSFEKKASAIALSCQYNERTGQSLTTKEIFARARQGGDPLAYELIHNQFKTLAVGISNVICVLQPQKVVIGGGLAGEGDYLIRHLNKYVKMLIPTEVPVVLSGTGQWGGAMGAALAAK